MLRLFIGFLMIGTLASASPAETWDPDYEPPRTEDGRPSFEGTWTYGSITRFERPRGFPDLVIPTERTDAYREAALEGWLHKDESPLDEPPAVGGSLAGAEHDTFEFGDGLTEIDGQLRTSWIVDPTDGQMPLKPWIGQLLRTYEFSYGNPETRDLGERCIIDSIVPISNFIPSNMYLQFIQTPSVVAIRMEVLNEVRLVRMGGDPLPAELASWQGDSVGVWDEDTLVVTTRHIRPEQVLQWVPLTPDAVITERFRRVADEKIHYRVTVDDPSIYTQAWTAETVFSKTDARIIDFSCHEHNYSLTGILGGARRQERVLKADSIAGARGKGE